MPIFKLDRNKPRLYMALYPEAGTGSDATYHSGIVYLPKNPKPGEKSGKLYHMRTDPGKDGIIWSFERKEVYARTHHLLSVALLGKVKKDSSEAEIHRILKEEVDFNQGERCRHWVWRAIEVCTIF